MNEQKQIAVEAGTIIETQAERLAQLQNENIAQSAVIKTLQKRINDLESKATPTQEG